MAELRDLVLATIDQSSSVDDAIRSLRSNPPSDLDELHHFESLLSIAKSVSEKRNHHTLLLVIHGIRDEGAWMEMIREVIGSRQITVQPIDFDDFGALQFLLGWQVDRIVEETARKIRQSIAQVREKTPDLRVMAIGHSFGTYVLLSILSLHTDIRLNRLVFCGSVAPRKFDYGRLFNSAEIVNECGARDILPILAEAFGLRGYGAAGVWGIRHVRVHDRFHDCGHNEYLKRDFVETYWKEFIEKGVIVKSPYEGNRRPAPRAVRLIAHGYTLLIFLVVFFCIPFVFSFLKREYILARWGMSILLWGGSLTMAGYLLLGAFRFVYPKSGLNSDQQMGM